MLAGVGFTVLGPVVVESYFNGLPDRRSLRVAMVMLLISLFICGSQAPENPLTVPAQNRTRNR